MDKKEGKSDRQMALFKTDSDTFVDLLSPYASAGQKACFEKALKGRAAAGFVLNGDRIRKDILLSYPSVVRDGTDSCLFRYDKEKDPLGRTLLHALGAFYILDPSSAYLTKRLSEVLPKGALVLDLCAAPGGKSITLKIRRKDLTILSNDISVKRAKELAWNVERMALSIPVLSLDPMALDVGPVFDCILLDAPCSGSGMVRKEEKMAEDWSEKKVDALLPVQKALLDKAFSLLKPGGILSYSTCSLSVEEDENQVEAFLKKHKEMSEIEFDVDETIIKGKHGYHLVPGIFDGEGFYFSIMKKEGAAKTGFEEMRYKKKSPESGYNLFALKGTEYLVEKMPQSLSFLPYLRPGFPLFDKGEHPKCPYDYGYSRIAKVFPFLPLEKEEALAFYRGEEVRTSSAMKDGLVIPTYEGLPIAFAKKVGGRLKNYLPKGLRANLE